jgi:hypothetical protein
MIVYTAVAGSIGDAVVVDRLDELLPGGEVTVERRASHSGAPRSAHERAVSANSTARQDGVGLSK